MKLLVVINTSAGFGENAIYDFMRLAFADGDEACVRYTDGATDPASLVSDADYFDAVVVSGGDGTIASVSYELAGTGIPVLPFPAGTANLLASNLLMPYEPRSIATMARDMNVLDFDIGQIEIGSKTIGFSIMAGAGYDAAIMHDALPSKKRLGPAAYFQAAITNPKPQKSKLTINIDGQTIQTEGLGVMLVNFSKIQFEIPITHKTSARDGLFDIVVLRAENAIELIPAFIAATLDRDGNMPSRGDSIEVLRGREVEVIADPPLPIQYDGEPLKLTTPFRATVLEGAARFIVSDEALDQYGPEDDD